MEDKVLLDVQGLKTYFHTFKGVVKAVDNVSFSLKEGEILGIVGESGSGKSVTSFSILKLVEDPGVVDADHIMFDGKDLAKISERDMSKIRGKDISMVFQDPMTSLNPLYTIQRQMEEVLILHEPQMNKAQRRERCIELLHAVGIPNPEERLKEYPNQFSGGMRQRVIIAIALATNPKLLIADEPTTALDVTIQEQILKLMKKLVKEHNTSLMLITHDLAVVSQMVDKINQVDEVATNVAAISEEQAASSDEILATSESMLTQAKGIAENSENVAKESRSLTESSIQLADQVKLFRI